MKLKLSPLLALVVFVLPVNATAERAYTIDSSRILLGLLVPDLNAEAALVDLGPAPRPGGSRLMGMSELNQALRSAGAKLTVSESVRVVRSSRRWTQAALRDFMTAAVGGALPDYATLTHLDVPRSLTTATTIDIGNVVIGQLPKRTGSVRTSAVIELMADGQLEQRVSLPLTVELGARPKPEAVERGQSVTITIDLGRAKITAPAVTLQSGEVGTVVLCRVLRTKKVLRVKLQSKTQGNLVTE